MSYAKDSLNIPSKSTSEALRISCRNMPTWFTFKLKVYLWLMQSILKKEPSDFTDLQTTFLAVLEDQANVWWFDACAKNLHQVLMFHLFHLS